jgi:hypothetical protein
MIFEVIDYTGILVKLSEETWQAKAGNGSSGDHPEIREYLVDIQFAIESPDLVFESSRDERSRAFYRLACGRGDFIGKHLVVIVKYVMEAKGLCGYVSTVYLSRSVYAKGRLLWKKMGNSVD